jgi:hypothetical protein
MQTKVAQIASLGLGIAIEHVFKVRQFALRDRLVDQSR